MRLPSTLKFVLVSQMLMFLGSSRLWFYFSLTSAYRTGTNTVNDPIIRPGSLDIVDFASTLIPVVRPLILVASSMPRLLLLPDSTSGL